MLRPIPSMLTYHVIKQLFKFGRDIMIMLYVNTLLVLTCLKKLQNPSTVSQRLRTEAPSTVSHIHVLRMAKMILLAQFLS